jgi:hypothetical protein
MAISRRALGLGLLGTSAAVTAGAVYWGGTFSGPARRVFGFYGGEKQRFLQNPQVVAELRRVARLELDARVAGSVELVRERSLLDQGPAFLWPSSQVNVDIARASGLRVLRNETILNSPIVFFSWSPVAEGLVKSGIAEKRTNGRYSVDSTRLVRAMIDGKTWADLGVAELFGRARMLSTDPNRSNSGFLFAGLVANLLTGDVATRQEVLRLLPTIGALFSRMGFKPHSSGKIFEDYLAGGVGAFPLIVGYENQLIEWIIADRQRWDRVIASAPAKPVVLYPRPTVFSAHPMIIVKTEALPLVDGLLDPDVQERAWIDHGFRGPVGALGKSLNPAFADYVEPTVQAVIPTPDADVMLEIIDHLARSGT